MSRVVLAMSGGVDSSVAAHLLCEAGHEVIGVFMRHGEQSPVATACESGKSEHAGAQLPIVDARLDHKQGCCSASDAEDGRRVADRLGIPYYALNLQAEFREIIDYCTMDVRLTRNLFRYGCEKGYLIFRNRHQKRIRIPVDWNTHRFKK